MKVTINQDGNLAVEQLTIELPQKQVNASVFWTHSVNDNSLYCYCLYQQSKAVNVCCTFKLQPDSFEVNQVETINDVVDHLLDQDQESKLLVEGFKRTAVAN